MISCPLKIFWSVDYRDSPPIKYWFLSKPFSVLHNIGPTCIKPLYPSFPLFASAFHHIISINFSIFCFKAHFKYFILQKAVFLSESVIGFYLSFSQKYQGIFIFSNDILSQFAQWSQDYLGIPQTKCLHPKACSSLRAHLCHGILGLFVL